MRPGGDVVSTRREPPGSDLTGFDLDAAVSVSDLRREGSWRELLTRYGKLRVERRGRGESAVVGVLVTPEVWRQLRDALVAADAAEEEDVAHLIDSREGGHLLQGKDLANRTADLLWGRPEGGHPEQ